MPDGGGWRTRGRGDRGDYERGRIVGYRYIHSALDDRTRLAYSEIHTDEKAGTAAAFWHRAAAWFATQGIHCERVISDNGGLLQVRALAPGMRRDEHDREEDQATPSPDERQGRTLPPDLARGVGLHPALDLRERHAGYDAFIHFYNHHRSHGGLGWASPAATLATFKDNLPAEHT